MITDRITKRMIDLQKSTLDMMLNTMSNIKEQSGRASLSWFEQMANLPQENLKLMRNWMDSVRDTRNEMNSIIRDGLDNWGNVVEQTTSQSEDIVRQGQRSATQMWKQEQQEEKTAKSHPPSADDLQNLKEQFEEKKP